MNAMELQRYISNLNLENEELKYELMETKRLNQRLLKEIQEKDEVIQEKEAIQNKMGHQLAIVTKTAQTLYEKFRAFKCRYYEEQRHNALLGCATEK